MPEALNLTSTGVMKRVMGPDRDTRTGPPWCGPRRSFCVSDQALLGGGSNPPTGGSVQSPPATPGLSPGPWAHVRGFSFSQPALFRCGADVGVFVAVCSHCG